MPMEYCVKRALFPLLFFDPLSGSSPFEIHTSSGKLDPPLESVCAGPTQVGLEKLIVLILTLC